MNVASKCPSSGELRELLDGNTPDSGQTEIVAHLDRCSGCQQALEAMANGDSSLVVTLLEQTAYKTPEPHSAYWPALKNAEQALTVDRQAPTNTPRRGLQEISLAFLDPPEDGSHLGSLANFNIVRVVGRGGMGLVLQAVDTCLQRDVAIKILDPEWSKDEAATERFCREARAAAKVSHENVVAVYQVEHDEAKDLPFLVMELITGESLEKKLEREGRLSLKEIISIGMQTASGLSAAHEMGLIHRDIKPGNILLERSGLRVKLTDFGLARAAEDVRLTRTGLVVGTPLYMSPEQASGEEIDARSDLFSLGVVLYELAAGEPPFNGKTPLVVLKRVTEDQPVPLKERNPDLPEWFVNIVDRLLAKKPAERFQTAREVANTLEHFWALLKSSETLICPKKKTPGPWRAISLGIGAGLLTLVLGALGVFLLAPPRDRHEDKIPTPLHVLKSNAAPLWSLAIAKDGKNLAMGNNDGTVKFWDIAEEKLNWSLDAHKDTIWALALSPNYLATGSDDGPAKIWDLHTRNEIHELSGAGAARALAFDADGKRLLLGTRGGSVTVWDAVAGKEIFRTEGHSGPVVAVAFAPDGKTMATASGDKTVKIWDLSSPKAKMTLQGHQAGVYGIAVSPDGKYLVSGSWDKTVRLWELASGTSIATLTAPTHDVWSVDFNGDGTLFAAAGEDQMVRVWSVESKKEVATFRGSTGTILNIRFVSESNLLVAAGKDGDARIWRLADLSIVK